MTESSVSLITVYIKDSYDKTDITLNPLYNLDENIIIIIEYQDYNYITKVRDNFKNKTHLFILSNDKFMNNKLLYIKNMIEMNHLKTEKFIWCDMKDITTYLSQGLPERIEKINLLTNDEINGCFLIDMAHIH